MVAVGIFFFLSFLRSWACVCVCVCVLSVCVVSSISPRSWMTYALSRSKVVVGLWVIVLFVDEMRPNVDNEEKQRRIERGCNRCDMYICNETFPCGCKVLTVSFIRVSDLMPMVMESTGTGYAYVRIHRREGKHRLLSVEELNAWKDRLSQYNRKNKNDRIYFLWGTAFEVRSRTHLFMSCSNGRRNCPLNWLALCAGSAHYQQSETREIVTLSASFVQNHPQRHYYCFFLWNRKGSPEE